MRCCEDVGLTSQLLTMVTSCSAQSHQVGLVEAAVDAGFLAFDPARVAEGSSDIHILENEVARLVMQVEHAKLSAQTAACLERAALLAFQAANLELKTAEEQAMTTHAA